MSPTRVLLGLMLLASSAAWAQEAPVPAEAALAPTSAPEAAPAAAVTAAPTANTGLNTDPISIEDSLTLRDPFKKPAKFADPGSDVSVPELERYALDQIKIIGIITGPKKAKALVATPSNKMFIVQENDKIGVYKGVIRKIKDKSILVREKIVNLVGQEDSTDSEIFLKTADTAKAPSAQQPPSPQRM